MPYVKVICPSCGGEIQLDDSKEFGFCLHCGTKVIFEEAVQRIELINQPKIENLMKLASDAYRDRDYQEAITYFNRVLEISGNNWKAVLYKGLSKAFITPVKDYPVNPLIRSISEAIDLASKDVSINLADSKRLAGTEFTRFLVALRTIADLSAYARYEDMDAYNVYYNNFMNILNGYEYSLSLADENFPQDIINVYRSILRLISELTVHKQLVDGRKVGITKVTRKSLLEKFEKYAACLQSISPSVEIPNFNRKNIEGGRI